MVLDLQLGRLIADISELLPSPIKWLQIYEEKKVFTLRRERFQKDDEKRTATNNSFLDIEKGVEVGKSLSSRIADSLLVEMTL